MLKLLIRYFLLITLISQFRQTSCVDEFGGKNPQVKIELDYGNLGILLKQQWDTSSCISQTISILVEAYFNLHYNGNRKFYTVWSGYDIYYCHLNEGLERRLFRFALHKLLGQPIVSKDCWDDARSKNGGRNGKDGKDICPLVKTCPDGAIIEDYGTIENPTTESVIQGLKEHGPLGILFRVNKSWSQYSGNLDNGDIYHASETKLKSNLNLISDIGTGFIPWHSQVLMGYGYKNNELFWILQDHYGIQTGDKGYFYVGENEINFMDYNLWYIKKASLGNTPTDIKGKKSSLNVAKGAFTQ